MFAGFRLHECWAAGRALTVHPLCPLCLFLQRPDDKRLAKFSDEVATVSTFSPSEWALGLASPSAVSALLSCNKVLVMPILNRRT